MTIKKFNEFVNEGKKEPKTEEEIDKFNDEFNDQLDFIRKIFKKNPLAVVKAFGCKADDLADGKFRLNKQLDFSEPDQIEKVYNKLKKLK